MKSRAVETITSNEEYVRMLIFDGVLPLELAGHEWIRIERAQHDAERRRHDETRAELETALREIARLKAA